MATVFPPCPCGYLAEGFLALDVSGMPEAAGEEGAVDAETSGEVGKGGGWYRGAVLRGMLLFCA